MKRRIQAADSIRFCVRGRGAQRLLGQAAQPVQQHKKQADARQNAGAAQQSLC